jgi:putative NADPH-quinone reductase
MKRVLAFYGSPRKTGNTSVLLNYFIEGVLTHTSLIETIDVGEINIDYCRGCLRCNVLGRCSLQHDDWASLGDKILKADVLVFATPIYFHHVTASMKKLIDRFRSFIHVQITESGLVYTPRQTWDKDFILLLSMGSPDPSEAQPVIDLFQFMIHMLGSGNKLHTVSATRMAVIQQLLKSEEELGMLYDKMKISRQLANSDFERNQIILKSCYDLGKGLE